MPKNNLTAEIKVRLAADEKEQLKQLADDAGLTMSEVIRSTLFSEKKLVFLVEGAEIAAALFKIRKDFERLCTEGVVPASEIEKLKPALYAVSSQLSAVTKHLTDIHDGYGMEEDDNGKG